MCFLLFIEYAKNMEGLQYIAKDAVEKNTKFEFWVCPTNGWKLFVPVRVTEETGKRDNWQMFTLEDIMEVA